jgi:poly(3-hydroxyalkanoate) synthetase
MCQAQKSLAGPALLVAAREDIVAPAERVVEIRDQRLATAEVTLIDGSGHCAISSSPRAGLKPSVGFSLMPGSLERWHGAAWQIGACQPILARNLGLMV